MENPHQDCVHAVAQMGKIMALGGNQSSGVTEFIMAGFPNLNSTKAELFSVFLLIYLLTLTGNVLIVGVV